MLPSPPPFLAKIERSQKLNAKPPPPFNRKKGKGGQSLNSTVSRKNNPSISTTTTITIATTATTNSALILRLVPEGDQSKSKIIEGKESTLPIESKRWV